jgi:hypothetical protein
MDKKMRMFLVLTLVCSMELMGCSTITAFSIQRRTETKDWVEKRTANHFEAHFSYFDGEYDLPIYLKRGQTITVYERWNVHPVKEPIWDSGIGSGWVDPRGNEFLPDADSCEEQGCVRFTAQRTGYYTLELLSTNEGGTVQVDWKIQ